ncbi:unnamed protein product [Mesocestoides corti]|uniref:PDZ domain-containing protein n=1 Tax=Mesocestoides corti TaxID=53468 RepID=A0A0R3UBS1_MESCO|nr:unnamed protein product [Mesocestoides corti]
MTFPGLRKSSSFSVKLDILKSIQMRGIGLSGPCQTPDFVPASLYLKAQKSDLNNAEGDDTTVSESMLDLLEPPISAPTSPVNKPTRRSQLMDFEVKLRRGKFGFGLRLIGGAEEGTQVQVGALTPGGSAENSGQIYPGDLIIAINGISVLGATHKTVIRLLDTLSRDLSGNISFDLVITLSLRGYRASQKNGEYEAAIGHFGSSPTCASIHQLSSQPRSVGDSSSEESLHSKLSSPQSNSSSPIRRLTSPRRPTRPIPLIYKVELHRRFDESFGFSVDRLFSPHRGCHIESITPGGPADRSKRLQIGDKIIEINGHSLALQPHETTIEQLCTKRHRIQLTIEKKESRNSFQIPELNENSERSERRSREHPPVPRSCLLEAVPEAYDSYWDSRCVSKCNSVLFVFYVVFQKDYVESLIIQI